MLSSNALSVGSNERTTTIWGSGHHLCRELTTELEDLRSKRCSDKTELHKEEKIDRIQADGLDRDKIRCTLRKCIHPLAVDTHSSDVLINVFTGEVSESNVNVNKSIEIAKEQLEKFKKDLSDGFRD